MSCPIPRAESGLSRAATHTTWHQAVSCICVTAVLTSDLHCQELYLGPTGQASGILPKDYNHLCGTATSDHGPTCMACQLCATRRLQAWPQQAAAGWHRGTVLICSLKFPQALPQAMPLHTQPRSDEGVL